MTGAYQDACIYLLNVITNSNVGSIEPLVYNVGSRITCKVRAVLIDHYGTIGFEVKDVKVLDAEGKTERFFGRL